jgi:hypothetical protein
LRFAPPTCRMPLGQYHDIPRADPGGSANPPVLTSSNQLSTLHRRFTCVRLPSTVSGDVFPPSSMSSAWP